MNQIPILPRDESIITEYVLYGLPSGSTEQYEEAILSTQCKTPQSLQKVIDTATNDGWHSFRVVVHHFYGVDHEYGH